MVATRLTPASVGRKSLLPNDKYRAGYAATDVRKAFLPAVVSTSGRIHGDLLRLLYLLADNKTVASA